MEDKTPKNGWIRVATRYRYGLPVLAELFRDQGCKFVTLIRRLEASDRAIRQALDHLMEVGWVIRNPGYGHPMRPEYILTDAGSSAASQALEIWCALQEWNEQEVALERWPLQVLEALGAGANRFSQIQRACEGISPRALTLALTKLEMSGLAVRAMVDARPPTTEYSATKWGLELRALSGDQPAGSGMRVAAPTRSV